MQAPPIFQPATLASQLLQVVLQAYPAPVLSIPAFASADGPPDTRAGRRRTHRISSVAATRSDSQQDAHVAIRGAGSGTIARPRRRHRRRRDRLFGRVSSRAHGLPRRGAPRTPSTHRRHHLALGRSHGDLRIHLRDVDRVPQVHARSLRATRSRDGAGHGLQAGGGHRVCRRQGPARGVPSRLDVQSLLRRGCARDLRQGDRGALPGRAHRRHPRRLLCKGGRPRRPGRRHDGAREGRADASRSWSHWAWVPSSNAT